MYALSQTKVQVADEIEQSERQGEDGGKARTQENASKRYLMHLKE